MLEVRQVSKRFQSRLAIEDVSFVLKRSEITGYIGCNGAGKTTTARMLAGLIPPTSGTILFQDRDIFAEPTEYKRRLGYVPEDANVYPHLTAVEYLELVGRLRLIPEKRLQRKIASLLEVFSLSRHGRRALASYSKGMRQKVLLAAALLHDPEILILDEALSGLDVGSELLVRAILRALAAEGKIVLFSSHGLDSVEKLCSRVLILHQGRLVADETVEGLRKNTGKQTLEDAFSRLVNQDDGNAAVLQALKAMRS